MTSFTPAKLSHKDIEKRLLLCLPLSPLDLEQGLALLRLWVDIEPEYNRHVGILIMLRYDMDKSVITHHVINDLKTKFHEVFVERSHLTGTGWPRGCNALEVGAYHWFAEATRDAKVFYNYMLIAEADTVPLRPTWLAEISEEARTSGAPIIGAYYTKAEAGCGHINGNCVMHKDMWRVIPEIWNAPPTTAWDAYIGIKALKLGKPSRLIFQHYQLGTEKYPWQGDDFLWIPKQYAAEDNPLRNELLQPALMHGIKTMQGIEAVRRRFKLLDRK